jgi:hypothetical protein
VGSLVLAASVDLVTRWLRRATTRSLSLSALGLGLELRYPSRCCVSPVLELVYGGLRADAASSDIRFTVVRAHDRLLLECDDEPSAVAADVDELLDLLDQALVIQVQRRRPDLFFAHSAVVERGGWAVLLVGPSGIGKSTTTWALTHHGFRYVSDELAPIEPGGLRVHPFARALRVKAEPPASFPLPAQAMRTDRTIHVPLDAVPGGLCKKSLPLGPVIFLDRSPRAAAPAIRPLSAAEATARLLSNALNPLAHHRGGMDAAAVIARGAPCLSLDLGELDATCRLVRTTMERLGRAAA